MTSAFWYAVPRPAPIADFPPFQIHADDGTTALTGLSARPVALLLGANRP
jgi:hypothetical protein